MKLTATILACGLATGMASAQNFSVIQNTREKMQGVRDNAAAASNAALGMQDRAPSAAEALHKSAASKNASSTPVAVKAVSVKSATTPKAGSAKAGPAAQKAAPKSDPMSAKAVPAGVPAANAAPVASVAPAAAADDDKPGENKWSAGGKRDPFLSPVVQRANGPGCSTGKKCLEIGDINLRGVVHAESGFIAVVSNGLNKAYFLRENDPVFNGYVVKITGDSIVFQETLQDRLGKTFTREVTKKITTPAV